MSQSKSYEALDDGMCTPLRGCECQTGLYAKPRMASDGKYSSRKPDRCNYNLSGQVTNDELGRAQQVQAAGVGQQRHWAVAQEDWES